MLSAFGVGLNATPTLQSPSIGWKRTRSAAVLSDCRVPAGFLSTRKQEPQALPIASLPRALDSLEEIRSRTRGKRVVVFLDYDGTLTPIVSNPDHAVLSDSMRATIERLAASKEVAIVSGRRREKVQAFVQLSSLIYAGSHGFDIAGPSLRHTIAEEALPALAAAREALTARLAQIPGAAVEDNEFSVSVHWRNVPEEHRPAVEAATRAEVEGRPEQLALTSGKCVFEVRLRPRVAPVWDKGAAVRFLLDHLLGAQHAGERGEERGGGGLEDVVPVYIGDDTTDEDAFAVLRELGGLSFVVAGAAEGERPRETLGSHVLADVGEVEALLGALASV